MAAKRASERARYQSGRGTGAYIEGNAARQIYARPAKRESAGNTKRAGEAAGRGNAVPAKRAVQAPARRSAREIARDHAKRRAIQRNRERAFAMNPGYVLFLSVAILIFSAVCGAYLYLQSETTTLTGTISALEIQISELKADNSTTQNRIESKLGVEDIKSAAAELGMSLPDESGILYYDADESDYMNQVGEVSAD